MVGAIKWNLDSANHFTEKNGPNVLQFGPELDKALSFRLLNGAEGSIFEAKFGHFDPVFQMELNFGEKLTF